MLEFILTFILGWILGNASKIKLAGWRERRRLKNERAGIVRELSKHDSTYCECSYCSVLDDHVRLRAKNRELLWRAILKGQVLLSDLSVLKKLEYEAKIDDIDKDSFNWLVNKVKNHEVEIYSVPLQLQHLVTEQLEPILKLEETSDTLSKGYIK